MRLTAPGRVALALAAACLLGCAARGEPPTPVPMPLDEEFERGAEREGTPGLVLPKLTKAAPPHYTAQAMRRKIQGAVEVQAVVGVDGAVDRVRIFKSLDKKYGLDEEALASARKWQFEPGTLNGKPVPVLVIVHMEFYLSN